MEKYVVLKDKSMDNGMIDEEIVSFHDTEEAASDRAVEVFYDIPEEDKDIVTVSVGLVAEEALNDLDNWESFSEAEILWIYDSDSNV